MQVKYDRKLLIAIGRSRKASQWQNKEMLWSEFLDKLATTTRTRETVAEYAAMPKGERDTIKDVGGFVGGYLKNGKRNNASVVNRCMLCLDADNADPGLMDDLDMTFINAYALYSTHSHTPEKMRLRLIIPLTRTVTPDEYAAVSRRVADDLGLSRFDPTTFEPARLMYWPSTPEDGEAAPRRTVLQWATKRIPSGGCRSMPRRMKRRNASWLKSAAHRPWKNSVIWIPKIVLPFHRAMCQMKTGRTHWKSTNKGA